MGVLRPAFSRLEIPLNIVNSCLRFRVGSSTRPASVPTLKSNVGGEVSSYLLADSKLSIIFQIGEVVNAIEFIRFDNHKSQIKKQGNNKSRHK